MKKTELKDFEEGVLAGERTIKETYPLEEKKKKVVCYTLSKMLWRGDEYDHADAEISYCCDMAKQKLAFINNAVLEPIHFAKMVYHERKLDECPFCGAEIVIEGK